MAEYPLEVRNSHYDKIQKFIAHRSRTELSANHDYVVLEAL